MPTQTYIDSGLANELKNWLICKRRIAKNNPKDDVPRRVKFMNQTRYYIVTLMINRRTLWPRMTSTKKSAP